MSNNYSGLAFWRSWHRSFYLWIVRYMYVPLGGAKFSSLNIWPIFTFVAIWHDIQLNLLAWSWLICLFILPELLCRKVLRPKLSTLRFYRHIAAFAATLSVLMMMTANLVGFSVGIDGFRLMMANILTRNGVAFIIGSFIEIFSACQIMLEWRREEERRGIKNNF
jgi:protein-cysteine N-palmitoyltransferase HHAT